MKNLLLTTTADTSVQYFEGYADVHLLDTGGLFRGDIGEYSTLYTRSHFSRPEVLPSNFTAIINRVGEQARAARLTIIDDMATVNEIIAFEDKWQQYQLFQYMMPAAQLANQADDDGNRIYKKRLSSRGSGIVWRQQDVRGGAEDWIVQERLKITEELRIYIVHGNVCPVAAIRQSKSMTSSVKAMSLRALTDGEVAFASKVWRTVPSLDFIGIDVAITNEGLRLIEVNRSPDFTSYSKMGGDDLVKALYEGIEKAVLGH